MPEDNKLELAILNAIQSDKLDFIKRVNRKIILVTKCGGLRHARDDSDTGIRTSSI